MLCILWGWASGTCGRQSLSRKTKCPRVQYYVELSQGNPRPPASIQKNKMPQSSVLQYVELSQGNPRPPDSIQKSKMPRVRYCGAGRITQRGGGNKNKNIKRKREGAGGRKSLKRKYISAGLLMLLLEFSIYYCSNFSHMNIQC